MKKNQFVFRLLFASCVFPFAANPFAVGQATLPPGGNSNLFGTPSGNPPKSSADSDNAPATGNSTTSGNYKSSSAEGMADRLFDVNSDSVDMENGSVQWKGRTFNLGNGRMMRARFERYLAAPVPSEDVRKYEELLSTIERSISPKNLTKENFRAKLQEAWNMLFEAGKFEADGENALTIASLVEKTAKMREESRDLQVSRNQLEQLREYQKNVVVRRAYAIETSDDEKAESAKGKKGGGLNNKTNSGKTELGYRLEEEKTTHAQIGKTDAEMALLGVRAKLEFQSQIVAFLMQRRFRHVTVATAFYRQLFKGGAQDLQVGQKQVKEMFPVSDFVPSIDSIDMLARDAIKDVDTGMKTVSQLYDSGERYGAFERLQETFFLGEYEPDVAFYDPQKKRTLLELWRTLRDLQRMGDERDLGGVEDAVNKVKAVAPDFPSAPVMSKVNNAMQASNLAVISAKQAAFVGDMPKAEKNIERATQIWPQNPAIKEFATQIVNRADLLSQKVPEFDRLYQNGKLREIYERKEEFAVALMQDKERGDQLRDILKKVGGIDALLMNAKVLAGQGNACMAWDVLQEAARLGGNDVELARARSELAPLVGVYANMLAVAERDEKAGNYSAAAVNLLAAQDINPASEYCRQAIQRVSALLMQQVRPAPAHAN